MGFQQGLSGLNGASRHLDTIGNNVSNASTVGFKQSQAQFADMFAASLSGSGAMPIGTGTKLVAVAQQFTQGNITNTNNPLDTAISGQGFFRLTDAAGAVLYSRNGQFQVDKTGNVVNNQGHIVSGYLADAAGTIVKQTVPLKITSTNLAPVMTTTTTVGANLDSRAAVPATAAFSTIDPTSYTSSTSLSVFDSLGASHVGTMYFARQPIATVGNGSFAAAGTAMTVGSTVGLAVGNTVTLAGTTYTITGVTNATTLAVTPASAGVVAAAAVTTNAPSNLWNTYLTIDNVLVPPIVAPATTATPFATLGFSPTGTLSTLTAGAGSTAGATLGKVTTPSFNPVSTITTSPQTITFDFNSLAAGTTQFGGNFGVNTLTQNGYTSGQLNSTSTGTDGTILGRYSNGQSRALGQISLTNFTNPQGLQPVGNNEWVETSASGSPTTGTPGSSSLGVLQASATEDSNVDLTAELVNMITAQRVYQANAQTIKTQDSLLQTITSLR
jgi:flagellar hook protein FlgE